MNKQIKDIRIYESDYENISGNSLPSNFGQKIFKPVAHFAMIGLARQFSLKLREYDFCFVDFDHLYINFSTIINARTVQKSQRELDKYHSWFRYIDFGLVAEHFNSLSESEQAAEMIYAIATCLKCYALTEQDNQNVDTVAEMIRQQGSDLQIIYKQKEKSGIVVKIVIKIKYQKGIDTCVQIEYGENSKVVKIDNCNDLMKLSQISGEIAITKKQVTIKPKQNFFAGGLTPIIVSLLS